MLELLTLWAVLAQVVPVTEPADADAYREALLLHLETMHSIECDYTFCCSIRTDNVLEKVQFKWKDGDLWYSSRPLGTSESDWIHEFLTEACVDNAYSAYWKRKESGKKYHHTDYPKMRFMANNELSPLTLLGISSPFSHDAFKDHLRHLLERTQSPILERGEDRTALYLYPEPADGDYEALETEQGAIVYMDREQRIVQVD